MGRFWVAVVSLALLAVGTACSAGGKLPDTAGPASTGAPVDTGGDTLGQLSPQDTLAKIGATAGAFPSALKDGGDYATLVSQNVSRDGQAAVLAPNWSAGSAEPDGLALATYSFSLPPGAEYDCVKLDTGTGHGGTDDLWVGLSNFEENRWDWFTAGNDSTFLIENGDTGRYRDETSGDLLMIIAATGTQPIQVCAMAFADSRPLIWPLMLHDSRRTSLSPYSSDNPNGTINILEDMGLWFHGPPAVAPDGSVYIIGTDKFLHALNSDYSNKWVYTNKTGFISNVVLSSDGTVYAASITGGLHAFNPDGSIKWIADDDFFGSLIKLDELENIYLSGTIGSDQGFRRYLPDGTLDAILPSEIYTTNVLFDDDGTIYYACNDGNGIGGNYLCALNPDLTEKWVFESDRPFNAHISQAPDGSIYYSCYPGDLYAINPDGSQKWHFHTETGSYFRDSWELPVGSDGTVYWLGGKNVLYAIAADGTPRWTRDPDSGPARTVISGGDGTIYDSYQRNDGEPGCYLAAVRPDGTEIWPEPKEISQPLSVGPNGELFCRGNMQVMGPDGSLIWGCLGDLLAVSSPVIASDGTIYLAAEHLEAWYLRAFTGRGEIIWEYPFARDDTNALQPGIGVNDTVYVNTGYTLDAFSPEGDLLCSYADAEEITEFTIDSTGLIYCLGKFTGSDLIHAICLNPDCSFRWSCPVSEECYVIAVDDNGYTYCVRRMEMEILAITPAGDEHWVLGFHDWVSDIAINQDGLIYACGEFCGCISPLGDVLWRTYEREGSGCFSNLAIRSDGNFLVDGSHNYEPDGDLVWTSLGAGAFTWVSIDGSGNSIFGKRDMNIRSQMKHIDLNGEICDGPWINQGLAFFPGYSPAINADGAAVFTGLGGLICTYTP